MNINICPFQPEDQTEWLRFRLALWPQPRYKLTDLKVEMEEILADPEQPVFVPEAQAKLGYQEVHRTIHFRKELSISGS